jgi:hypothetical protein
MKEIQIPRKEIQIFRNEIQAGWEQNPNPAERNPNSNPSISFAESSLFKDLRRPPTAFASNAGAT